MLDCSVRWGTCVCRACASCACIDKRRCKFSIFFTRLPRDTTKICSPTGIFVSSARTRGQAFF